MPSVGYRILRTTIVTSGLISSLATAVLFSILDGGLGAIVVAIYIGPFSIGGGIICAVAFVLYCALYFLRWKSLGYKLGKTVLFLGIVAPLLLIILFYQSQQRAFDDIKNSVYGNPAYGNSQAKQGDTDDVTMQKYIFNRLSSELPSHARFSIGFGKFETDFGKAKTEIEKENWYVAYFTKAPCGEEPIYRISSDGVLLGIFLKKCQTNPAKYFCTGFSGTNGEARSQSGTNEVVLADEQDENNFCGATRPILVTGLLRDPELVIDEQKNNLTFYAMNFIKNRLPINAKSFPEDIGFKPNDMGNITFKTDSDIYSGDDYARSALKLPAACRINSDYGVGIFRSPDGTSIDFLAENCQAKYEENRANFYFSSGLSSEDGANFFNAQERHKSWLCKNISIDQNSGALVEKTVKEVDWHDGFTTCGDS